MILAGREVVMGRRDDGGVQCMCEREDFVFRYLIPSLPFLLVLTALWRVHRVLTSCDYQGGRETGASGDEWPQDGCRFQEMTRLVE